MSMVSFANNLFKVLSTPPKTITVAAHSKEKEWGKPLVRLGQGLSERDIYNMSQIPENEKEVLEVTNAQ